MKKLKKKLFWIYVLSASIYFTQGIEGVPGLALFAYLKETLHYSASLIMYLGALASIAWIIKPVWGFLIDNYFTKNFWIILSLIGSFITCLYLGLSSIIPIFILIPLLMFDDVNTAIRDVGCDGIMCVEGKEANECDTIQSIQWISITVASIIVGMVGGYIADHFNYHIGYLCLLPIYIAIAAIVLKYRTIILKNKTQVQKNRLDQICINCRFSLEDCNMNTNYLCKSFQARFPDKKRVHILETICSYKELIKNKQFLLGCLFIFVYNFAPGFGTPLQFIERNSFGWSWSFMGIIGALSSICGIIGAIAYYKYSKKINVKKCLFVSVFIVGITNLCYLYFTSVSAIVYSLIFGVLGMFIFLNMMTFMAKSTLKGKEATSFALLCSINNLSSTLSTIAGAWLFPLIGLKTIIILASASAFLSLPILNRLKIKES
jgi:MFS family permease